jgi:hypothetical protein
MNKQREMCKVLRPYLLIAALIVGLVGCLARRDDPAVMEDAGETAVVQVAHASRPAAAEMADSQGSEPPSADNYYCYVCHLNYDGEELSMNHEIGGIGCEKCHGKSDRHSADEDGIVPPEIMYSRGRINLSCMECHSHADIGHVSDHKELLSDLSGDKHVCTDCHGKHRLKVRTRIWDKETGKLISDDGVRMMYEDSPTR